MTTKTLWGVLKAFEWGDLKADEFGMSRPLKAPDGSWGLMLLYETDDEAAEHWPDAKLVPVQIEVKA